MSGNGTTTSLLTSLLVFGVVASAATLGVPVIPAKNGLPPSALDALDASSFSNLNAEMHDQLQECIDVITYECRRTDMYAQVKLENISNATRLWFDLEEFKGDPKALEAFASKKKLNVMQLQHDHLFEVQCEFVVELFAVADSLCLLL